MTDPDNAPENTDPKKNDDTAEQPTAAAEESGDTELTDDELGDAAGGATPQNLDAAVIQTTNMESKEL